MRTIVITTVHHPTPAIDRWNKIGDHLIVVGDQKTPPDWMLDGAVFLPANSQRGAFADALPWNHYCRKNLGYVEAIRAKADVIVDTDDDNIPKVDWNVPAFDASYEVVSGSTFASAYNLFDPSFANAYKLFDPFPDGEIWPRGYPLDLIRAPAPPAGGVQDVKVGVWQGLADGDPDVDAIYRLTRPANVVRFRRTSPLALARGTACPFNSQNTVWRREVFPLLYLPAVAFRFTDILRSIVAQPILWAAGYRLGFTGATVVQKRNQHDIMNDFRSEIPMYLHATTASQIVTSVVKGDRTVSANMRAAYAAIEAAGIVDRGEPLRVESWLQAIRGQS